MSIRGSVVQVLEVDGSHLYYTEMQMPKTQREKLEGHLKRLKASRYMWEQVLAEKRRQCTDQEKKKAESKIKNLDRMIAQTEQHIRIT